MNGSAFFKAGLVGVALWALIPQAARAVEPVQTYAMVKEKSALKFSAISGSESVKGVFERFTLDVAFDPERLEESHIRAEIDVDSLRVSDAGMHAALMGAEWLDVGAAPKALFVSDVIDRIPSTDDYHATGMLTLRGISKPVTINFRQDFTDGNAVVVSGFSTLQRNDYGVGQGEWKSDDKVKFAVRVEFRVHAVKQ